MSDTIADLIAKRFIARRDVKAIQHKTGAWSPHQEFNPSTGKHDGPRIPWSRSDLNAHLSGDKTYGHYLLNPESQCKLFAFDVDLDKGTDKDGNITGFLPVDWVPDGEIAFGPCGDLRTAWLDRSHSGRNWMKYQFKMVAHMLAKTIQTELDLPCAAAYSGGKGIHVYAFTGLISAAEAREGAQIIIDSLDCLEPLRGENFFQFRDKDPFNGYPNLTIETFPKQDSLDGKDLGNLMRLPLGRNLKSTDPTFFIDMTSPVGQFQPVDAEFALTTDNPWKRPGE